ncbi:MAG: DUF4442 domain-containing protein [Bdellovibrionaceae bacterium]|nr:DUF4442 domain-containing protein [Pseudobdellovibrionaceae bacterium]
MSLENVKLTALVNGIGFLKLPLLAFCFPKVKELSEHKSVIKIRLGYRTKNHIRSMYFGALAIGAELSVAITAVDQIQKSKKRIDFIFKDFKAEFLKRADGHVLFICEEAGGVKQLIAEAAEKEDRLEKEFRGYAVVEGRPEDKIMTYSLTLSVKKRG